MDFQEGRYTIKICDRMKQGLHSHFFFESIEIFARFKLRELRHADLFREYVKQFTDWMLDIPDMSKEEYIFYFFQGLKPWIRVKSYEQDM